MEGTPKILYIDDEPENLVGFEISFSKYFKVFSANNTREGYKLLQAHEFAVALVDYKMPEEDGISFIERIKEEFSAVIFIVISGYAELDVVIKAINMNCLYSFVQKPWNFNELKIVLNNAVESYRMKKENRMLMEQMVEYNRQLEASFEREKKLSNLKNVFLQNISHEIRTPLNAIIGFASLAFDEIHNEEIKNSLKICMNSGYELLKVIENILSASLIISDQVVCFHEPFFVNGVVNDIIDKRKEMGLFNPEIDFINEIDTNIQIFNDKEKIIRVLDLIIDNSFKFTDAGFVKVSAKVSNVDNMVVVTVADTGIGIPSEKQDSIFEPFRQADESNLRKFGGNGLGLFIVKGFIEKLGGKVWLESSHHEGTSIHFSVKKNIAVPDFKSPEIIGFNALNKN